MATGINPIAEFLSGVQGSYRRHKQRQYEKEDEADQHRIRTIGQILNDPNLPDETRRAVTADFTAMLGGKDKEKKAAYENILRMINTGVPGPNRTRTITTPGQAGEETRPRTVEPPPTRTMEGIVVNQEANNLPVSLGRPGSAFPVPPAEIPVGTESTTRPFFSTREERIQNEIEPQIRLRQGLEPLQERADERRTERELLKLKTQQEAYIQRAKLQGDIRADKRLQEFIRAYGGDELLGRQAFQRDIESRVAGREARTENAQANTALTKLKMKYLPEDKAAVQVRLAQGWERIRVMEERIAKGENPGLTKSDISTTRLYMNRIAGLYQRAETLINKNLGEESQYEPGALDPAETQRRTATREQIFDQIADEARREAMNLKVLLGDKVEIGTELGPDNLNGDWVYVKPTEDMGDLSPVRPGGGQQPGTPSTTQPKSNAKVFPASKLKVYADKYTNGDINAARKELTTKSGSNPNPYTIDETK